MIAKSVQSKKLLVRVYFGRSYQETGMGISYGVCRTWLGAFCYLARFVKPSKVFMNNDKSFKLEDMEFKDIKNSLLTVIFFIVGTIIMFTGKIVAGCILEIIGIILLPQIHITKKSKIIIMIVGLVFSGTFFINIDKKEQKVLHTENTEMIRSARESLDNFISLGKEANLILSYEFSDKTNVIYVSKLWYTQTVDFKKNTFLNTIANLKEVVTGDPFFEVRDAYSNEKIAEFKWSGPSVLK